MEESRWSVAYGYALGRLHEARKAGLVDSTDRDRLAARFADYATPNTRPVWDSWGPWWAEFGKELVAALGPLYRERER